MSILILAVGDGGYGYLAKEKRADRIIPFGHHLTTGPIPINGPQEEFFRRQQAIYENDGLFHEAYWFESEDPEDGPIPFKRVWNRLPEVSREFDRVELWVDPDAHAQLLLVQLLSWLGSLPDVASRLWLKQAETSLTEHRPGDWVFPPRPVCSADLALAQRAWNAFGAHTPEPWNALLDDTELGRLPGLPSAVLTMLNELPDRSGLGATARRILHLADREGWWDEAERRGNDISPYSLKDEERRPMSLIQRVKRWRDRLALGQFQIGQELCDLGNAPTPGLTGSAEPRFTGDMLANIKRFKSFRESRIFLTDFGRRVDEGTEDWSERNPIHRWWGGTRLTNETLWRWDATLQRLSPPV